MLKNEVCWIMVTTKVIRGGDEETQIEGAVSNAHLRRRKKMKLPRWEGERGRERERKRERERERERERLSSRHLRRRKK